MVPSMREFAAIPCLIRNLLGLQIRAPEFDSRLGLLSWRTTPQRRSSTQKPRSTGASERPRDAGETEELDSAACLLRTATFHFHKHANAGSRTCPASYACYPR